MVNKVLSEMIKSNWKQNTYGFAWGGRYACDRKISSWNSWVSLPSGEQVPDSPWGCGGCTSLRSLQLLSLSRAAGIWRGYTSNNSINLQTPLIYLKMTNPELPEAPGSSWGSLQFFIRRGGTTRSFILIKKVPVVTPSFPRGKKRMYFLVSLLHSVFILSDLHVGRIIYTWLKVILFIVGFCREDTYIPSCNKSSCFAK